MEADCRSFFQYTQIQYKKSLTVVILQHGFYRCSRYHRLANEKPNTKKHSSFQDIDKCISIHPQVILVFAIVFSYLIKLDCKTLLLKKLHT